MDFDQYADEIHMTPDQRDTSHESFGGAPIYIPKITQSQRERRDEEIRRMYRDNRYRIHEIAQRFGMSERQVRRILRMG